MAGTAKFLKSRRSLPTLPSGSYCLPVDNAVPLRSLDKALPHHIFHTGKGLGPDLGTGGKMRVIRRSLAPSISPYTNIPRSQRRSCFLQHMLHDLAFFQIAQNNAVYFFFNILDLSIMTGQKITVFVVVLQISKGIQIA